MRLWVFQDPDAGASQLVPRGFPLKVLEARGERFWVYYSGEGGAGVGVVDAVDVSPSRAPRWVEVRETTPLHLGLEAKSTVSAWLQKGSVLEVLEDAGKALRVFYRGDGRERDAVDGWVDVGSVVAAGPALAAESRGVRWLTWSRVSSLRAGDGVWLKVPFRSQLDGSPSAMANCGPASIAMALEFFRVSATTAELRSLTDRLQGTSDPETGVAIEHLQRAVELMGLKGYDLYAGDHFKRWSLEDLRRHLIQGHPVVPQLRFRLMPGRGESDYQEDHYVVLCGVQGGDFIYNDSVDTDGPGYGRVMSADSLTRAWEASYFPFAGFAVGEAR